MIGNLSLGLLLAVCVALESTLVKWVNMKARRLPSEEMVLAVEIAKGFISFLIYSIWVQKPSFHESEARNGDETRPLVSSQAPIPQSPWSFYLVPSILYTISNNVTFLALERITPAHFNLLMNLKIPMTAFLAWMFLSYRVNGTMLISFALLTLGACVASLTGDKSIEMEPTIGFMALTLMLIYSACSAGGAISTEYITRREYASENMFMQNVKFCACGFACNLAVVFFKLGSGIRRFEDYTSIEWLQCVAVGALVANGLMTGIVIKYAGSILKTYAVAVALFLSAFLTWYVFDVTFGPNFYIGACTCFVAILLYAKSRDES